MSLINDLKRRNVFRVTAAYLALCWLITQVTGAVVPALHLPDSISSIVVWLAVIGFPFVVLFSWVYELTPEGLKRESEVDSAASIIHLTSKRLDYAIIVLLVLAIGLFAVQYFRPSPGVATPQSAAPETCAAASTTEQLPSPEAAPEISAVDKSIAVLPFTNLTGSPELEIVADGLAEEVANQLAINEELRVTGLRSSFSFKGMNEDLRSIASKLDVSKLLEGSLSSDGSRLRVTVQLIDGRDGTRRWSSRPYEHEQSEILAVQNEIAEDVARALSVTLDVGALNRAQGGTTNLEAATRYWEWRKLILEERWELEDQRRRVRLMREGVQLDPQFVIAWASLADSLDTLVLFVGDTQPKQAEQLRAEAEQAWGRVLELAPDSWIALKKRSEDLLRAEKWAESEAVARKILESGPFTLERAQPLINVLFAMGRFNETIELQARVIELEPRVMYVSRDQQWNLYAAKRFEESEAEYQRSQTLDGNHSEPDFVALLRGLARQDTDPQTLRDLFQRVSSGDDRLPQWLQDFSAAIPDRQAMLAVLKKLVEAGEDIPARFADVLGDRDLALTLLRDDLQDNRGRTDTWWEPWLLPHSGVSADPRFKELMREAGLAEYWRQSGNWADFCEPVGEDDFECH